MGEACDNAAHSTASSHSAKPGALWVGRDSGMTALRRISIYVAVFCFVVGEAGPSGGRRYEPHEKIKVLANKVGPFNNPSETYHYYSLPFCTSDNKKRHEDFGERLLGDIKVVSPYDVTFLDPVPWRELCHQTYSHEDLKVFTNAIENEYYFEMFIDNLPMWGYVGEIAGQKVLLPNLEPVHRYIYTHLVFSIGYNGNQIVSVNVTTKVEQKVEITKEIEGTDVQFTYEVEWLERPDLTWENRMSRYHDSRFLPDSFEIHWLLPAFFSPAFSITPNTLMFSGSASSIHSS